METNPMFKGVSRDVEMQENEVRESIAGLPSDVIKAFDEIDKYRNEKRSGHRSLRFKLLSTFQGRQSDIDGFVKFMKKVEDDEAEKLLNNDVSSFKYGNDRSFNRNCSPEDVFYAIKRRAAWRSQPIRMAILTATQIILCAIIIISTNVRINVGTLIMAILFIFATGASNPLKITHDLIEIIEKQSKKIGMYPTAILLAACFPVTFVAFGITLTIDLVVGEILDISFANLANIVVRMVVVFTAISVGLRSGNPINAIQTFAGFDFIDSMDEVVIDSFEVDYEEIIKQETENRTVLDRHKVATVRVCVYIAVPIVVALFFYVTIANNCYAFCNTDDNL